MDHRSKPRPPLQVSRGASSRYGWQIELFFRWLKSHMHLSWLLGYSRNAMMQSVTVAVVVHLLLLTAMHVLGFAHRSPSLLRRLVWVHTRLTPEDTIPDQTAVQLALPINLPDSAAPT